MKLPHNLEAERYLLGRILADTDYYLEIQDRLRVEDFYHTDHKMLWSAYQAEFLATGKPEFPAILERLNLKGAEVYYRLSELMDDGQLYQATEWPIKKVLEASSQRRLLVNVTALQEEIGIKPDHEVVERILALAGDFRRSQGKVLSPAECADLAFTEMEEAAARKGELKGIPTGWEFWDQHIGGMQGKRITLVTGPTGHGKSAIGVNWLSTVGIKLGIPCLFITAEMREIDAINRIVAILADVDTKQLERGIAGENVMRALEQIKAGKLFISDNCPRDVGDVALLIEKYAIKAGIKVWCLDYLGRLDRDKAQYGDEARDERFARWVKTLWNVSQRHDLHGVLLGQVNKAEEIADSAKIEQEVDHHLFFKYDKSAKRHVAECKKNRFGPSGFKYGIDYEQRSQAMDCVEILK